MGISVPATHSRTSCCQMRNGYPLSSKSGDKNGGTLQVDCCARSAGTSPAYPAAAPGSMAQPLLEGPGRLASPTRIPAQGPGTEGGESLPSEPDWLTDAAAQLDGDHEQGSSHLDGPTIYSAADDLAPRASLAEATASRGEEGPADAMMALASFVESASAISPLAFSSASAISPSAFLV